MKTPEELFDKEPSCKNKSWDDFFWFMAGFKACQTQLAERCCEHFFSDKIKDGYLCCDKCGIYMVKNMGYAILSHDIDAGHRAILDAIKRNEV